MEGDVVLDAARFLVTRASEPLQLGDVADHVNYSPFHLARAFERHMGMPPGRFLAAHRFQLAKRLLLDGNERVIDVCHAAGFTAPGTFSARFATLVGASPVQFRNLPELLAGAPPRPVVVPGHAPSGGVISGAVDLSPPARALLGPAPSVYVGIFPHRAARGFPVSGALLRGPGSFYLSGIPEGRYWVLASAVGASASVRDQLVPSVTVSGFAAEPVDVNAGPTVHHRDVLLEIASWWSAPVLIALPRLACPIAQDWR